MGMGEEIVVQQNELAAFSVFKQGLKIVHFSYRAFFYGDDAKRAMGIP